MKIESVTSPEFGEYGRVLDDYDWTEVTDKMQSTPVPEDVIYVRSDEELEKCKVYERIKTRMYGESNIQFGYCNGHNSSLNALEYHRSSEVNLAVTDMVLLLGLRQDITDAFTYDTAKVRAFLVPAGTAVEIYATTLHYAPCNVHPEGFRCLVILPEGTNAVLTAEHDKIKGVPVSEDSLLAAQNKWLLAHEDAQIEGAWNGLKGQNITIKAGIED